MSKLSGRQATMGEGGARGLELESAPSAAGALGETCASMQTDSGAARHATPECCTAGI